MVKIDTEELTEEEKVQLEIDTRKKNYKLLTKYLNSKECDALVKKYEAIGESLLKQIEEELQKRRDGT
jgi:hypothetical protein